MIAELRFFAAAADAAGTDTATVEVPQGATVEELAARVHDAVAPADPDRLTRVLGLCSFLVNGKHAEREAVLPDDPRVDVLPPFAGG
ncbi:MULTISPECIES: MoaD/ThiS family protein [Trueperella]|uniref:ThiS family protein n=1 Tax=Trueperella bernardiae TaxID=59561 RepID=A0A0W1KKX8_9ACTO|nr:MULTISPECIES: MoaD/ThiS family protein [Trueperella]KTF04610.1 ThiS family protein [Trueperella bernardiae]MCM3907637.1 MoaD/ThiS family protein [Trueperella bernardiae]MDK8601014.1 MoaD/ThiS family protein [Trueperella bernardiae]OCW60032.1 hypothetical protein AKG36_06915 [Trueperella bernardiae]PKZ89135.1 molybdopterin synthase sulfur carrier subunit [Trueperella bernardiae]